MGPAGGRAEAHRTKTRSLATGAHSQARRRPWHMRFVASPHETASSKYIVPTRDPAGVRLAWDAPLPSTAGRSFNAGTRGVAIKGRRTMEMSEKLQSACGAYNRVS
jgi:hypothetical protein